MIETLTQILGWVLFTVMMLTIIGMVWFGGYG